MTHDISIQHQVIARMVVSTFHTAIEQEIKLAECDCLIAQPRVPSKISGRRRNQRIERLIHVDQFANAFRSEKSSPRLHCATFDCCHHATAHLLSRQSYSAAAAIKRADDFVAIGQDHHRDALLRRERPLDHARAADHFIVGMRCDDERIQRRGIIIRQTAVEAGQNPGFPHQPNPLWDVLQSHLRRP